MKVHPTTERPTVCHVLHSLCVGGAELLAVSLGRKLSSEFRVVFACLDEAGPLATDLRSQGFAVQVIGRSQGFDVGCAHRLQSYLRAERVQLVHAHQYTPFFYAVMPGLRRRRPPVVFTEHGRHFPDHPSRKRSVFNRLCLRRRDRVTAVGKSVRQALIQNEGIDAGRIEVIYNGVDLDRYADGGDRRSAVQRELGIDASAFVMIQVARLDPLKDHSTAIRTVARLRDRHPDLLLLLVGDGTERAKIEADIAHYDVANAVRLLGYRADIPQLLAAADVMLLTSVSEGIPVTLIEGMAAGLPVVATDVGGVREVVEHGATGYLTPAGDDAALADALDELICHGDLCKQMGRRGAERAFTRFSEREMLAGYRELYLEVIGASGSAFSTAAGSCRRERPAAGPLGRVID